MPVPASRGGIHGHLTGKNHCRNAGDAVATTARVRVDCGRCGSTSEYGVPRPRHYPVVSPHSPDVDEIHPGSSQRRDQRPRALTPTSHTSPESHHTRSPTTGIAHSRNGRDGGRRGRLHRRPRQSLRQSPVCLAVSRYSALGLHRGTRRRIVLPRRSPARTFQITRTLLVDRMFPRYHGQLRLLRIAVGVHHVGRPRIARTQLSLCHLRPLHPHGSRRTIRTGRNTLHHSASTLRHTRTHLHGIHLLLRTIPPVRGTGTIFTICGLRAHTLPLTHTTFLLLVRRYVIYPIQVLAKSCKPVPVMIMGAFMGKHCT